MRITKKMTPDLASNSAKSKDKKIINNSAFMNNIAINNDINNKKVNNYLYKSTNLNYINNKSLMSKNEDYLPIKVSLNYNNIENNGFYPTNYHRLYTTKTADSKSLYIKSTNSKLLNEKNLSFTNVNDKINKNINYINNKNRPKVISVSPYSVNEKKFNNEENNNEKENNNNKTNMQKHKIRYLLSSKFTYNKPRTTSRQFSQKTYSVKSSPYDTKTFDNKLTQNIKDDNISCLSGYTNINQYNSNYKINQIYSNKNLVDVKLDDLILFEERLNDVSIAINNKRYDGDASNECAEFLVFYFHSSLKGIFICFFKEESSKEVIQSANNLLLLIVIIIYHLSLTPRLLKKVIVYFNKILELMKINLYLIIKQLQLYKGENFIKKNNFYFKTFNIYLQKQNLTIFSDEESIIQKITQNCRIITTELKKVLKEYMLFNNPYYQDFSSLFNNLSILTENDFNTYFFQNLYGFNLKNNNNNLIQTPSSTKQKNYNIKTTNNYINNDIIENIKEEDFIDNTDVISVKTTKTHNYYGQATQHNNKIKKIIADYEKIKVKPPFIKTPNKKKYTLVLDLDETLINIEMQDINTNKYLLHLRPGLFSFLSSVKPYYELITFTSASKQYAEPIIKEIEMRNKYFDYNFYREHSAICGNDFVKDISRIGRNIKSIIIVDNSENNFRLNKENGIKIMPFYGNKNKNDIALFELKKILILIYRNGYNDLRKALKDFAVDIKNKVSGK